MHLAERENSIWEAEAWWVEAAGPQETELGETPFGEDEESAFVTSTTLLAL